jgi:regulatory protein
VKKKPTSESGSQSLRGKALDLLSRRDYSRRELSRKLSRHATDAAVNSLSDDDDLIVPEYAEAEEDAALERDQECELLLDELEERGWLSDQRFASVFVNSRARRGIGPQRLLQELRQKGVSAEDARQALDNCDTDWFESALQCALKKQAAGERSEKDPRQQKAVLVRFLMYRGFSSDHIQYALEETLKT